MIRLQRTGRKNNPSFRIVLTGKRNGPQSGKFLEVLGFHNPRLDKPGIKGDRVLYWISKGAQVSPTVHNLLVNAGIITAKKINVLPKKSPIKKEITEEENKAVEETPKNDGEIEGVDKVADEEAPVDSEAGPDMSDTDSEKSENNAPEEPITPENEVLPKEEAVSE